MNELALDPAAVAAVVRAALREDVGSGDVTTRAIAEPDAKAAATLIFRAPAVVCGLPVAEAVFRAIDPSARVEAVVAEGGRLAAAGAVARVECLAAALLTGERVALNLVARLAATATLTRRYVDAVAGTRARILDTRKTTPGLRVLERYAVRVGGGANHRFGLFDAVLIKDNHLRLAGSVTEAVRRARAGAPGLRIEVEVESPGALREAIAAGADMVLLDNMPLALLRESVAIVARRIPTEASGGVTLETVRAIAETGVDYISVGALTHSAGAIDVSLEVD